MTIAQSVITDLMRPYFSGEASADSVALIDAYLAEDPQFAQRIRELQSATPPSVAPSPELEMNALNATRRLIRIRSMLCGIAIFFTLLPFSFVAGSDRGLSWLFISQPLLAGVAAAVGAAVWVTCFRVRERLHGRMSSPDISPMPRMLWFSRSRPKRSSPRGGQDTGGQGHP